MADNTTLNLGSGGDVIATDDVGGVKYQIVKHAFGALDTANVVTSTATNPFPVALSDTDNAVLDTIDTALDAINAKLVTGTVIGDVNLGAVDNAVLDAIAASVAGTVTVGGTVTANLSATDNAVLDTIDAVLDTIKTDTASIISGQLADGHNVTVDNASIAVTAASLPLPAGAATSALQLADGHNVTIDNAAGAAAVNIQDGGNTITVDGTVTANLSTTDNTVLDTIDTALDAINAKLVTGTVIGDVNLGATDNAVLDAIVVDTSVLVDGTSGFSSIDLDETEEQIKGTAGKIYSIYAWNTTAVPVWLQIFDNTAAAVTVGTTAPTWNFPIPANADSDVAGLVVPLGSMGLTCATAITMAVTAAAGTTAGDPGASAAGVFVTYI